MMSMRMRMRERERVLFPFFVRCRDPVFPFLGSPGYENETIRVLSSMALN